MGIAIADVDHVAELARLYISEEEKQEVAEKLGAILHYMEQLSEIDTENVLPTTHVFPLVNVLREDEPAKCLFREEALVNCMEPEEGCFRVPKIL